MIKAKIEGKAIAILIVIILLLGIGVVFVLKAAPAKNLAELHLVNADVIVPTHPVQSFVLTDDNGKSFTADNLKGQWTFIFFGFTNCPQLCPTTMTTLNRAFGILQKDNKLANAKVLFVSIDPARDTLKQIGQYVTSFNKGFLGATGTDPQIAAVAKQFGVVYLKQFATDDHGKADPKNYWFDHSGVILLINPQAELQAIFSLPHNATTIAQNFEAILQNYN